MTISSEQITDTDTYFYKITSKYPESRYAINRRLHTRYSDFGGHFTLFSA